MKSRTLMRLISIAALATPTIWGSLAAQDATTQADGTATTTPANPVPLINQPLVPDTKIPGAAGFTLTVNGTGFVSGATVNWNGSPLTTTFVSGSRLRASVPASNVAKAGPASVAVVNPGPEGKSSNAVFFPVALPVDLVFAASTFAAGTGPGSVATADFNKDGRLDLVVPGPGSGTVSILLGKGNGTFGPPTTYKVGQGAARQFFQVAIGDLNEDGNPDFVVSDYNDNYVSVFLGNGDGTFKPGVTYAVGANPTDVVIADLNRDGKLDLAVTNQNCPNNTCVTGTVSVLLGNGDGTFQPHVDFDTGQDPNWVTVGDFNRDGKLDLAVIDGQGNAYTSAVVILLGNGDGTFHTASSYPLNTNAASGIAADFNSDGKLDLAVADNIGVLSILLGNGDGTFQPRVDYSAGSFPWGSLAVGDLNQDGYLDLAFSNSGSGSVSVFLGNGDGTFQPDIQVPTGGSSGALSQGVVAGDFTQTGRLDLAVANNTDNTVSILLQSGTVSLSPASLNFGVQVVGTKATKILILTNLGNTNLSITGITIAGTNVGDFTQTNSCGSSLGQGAHCTISVTFTPSQLGPAAASLMVTDSAPGSPHSVSLIGFGATSGPNATLSPSSLNFGTQLVSMTSAAQPITLNNYGTQPLSVTEISISGYFQQTHTCGTSLASGASCTISVTFAPKVRGNLSGTLSITDNAPGSPQTVSVTGVGTVVQLNPASLSFGGVPLGTSSTQATTLTNVGSTALSITGIVIAGADTDEFHQTNTCGTGVVAGKSCAITVTFTPKEKGSDGASVSISDNDITSPQHVPLSGAGCVWQIVRGHRKCLATITTPVQATLRKSGSTAAPSVTGTNRVGTRIIDLVDSSRLDPYATNSLNRELLVRFWYPASAEQDCKRADYTSPGVWNYFAELTRLPLPAVTTNSCMDAPVADGEHPVVVFTHGYTGTFTDYTYLVEDLASRGYIVVSIDHTYEATAVEFPDQRFVKSLVGSHLTNTWQTDDQTLSSALDVRLDDVKFVIDELERLNTSSGNAFAGKLDLTRLALAGHSLGGLTAWFGAQRDPRFKAAVLLDPYLPDVPFGSTETPVMLLTMGGEQRNEVECQLWSDLLGPRFSVNFRGAEHVTPSDLVWLAKGAVKAGPMGPDKTIEALRDYIAAFLDTNVRGKPLDPLLTGPSAKFPDAEVTTQKQALCGEAATH